MEESWVMISYDTRHTPTNGKTYKTKGIITTYIKERIND